MWPSAAGATWFWITFTIAQVIDLADYAIALTLPYISFQGYDRGCIHSFGHCLGQIFQHSVVRAFNFSPSPQLINSAGTLLTQETFLL